MIESLLPLGIVVISLFAALVYAENKSYRDNLELEIDNERLKLQNIILIRENNKMRDIIHMIKDKTEFVEVDKTLIFYQDTKENQLEEIFKEGLGLEK